MSKTCVQAQDEEGSAEWWALTFEAEGNDDHTSRYYSRRSHVPSRTSGVTIGRGYDMKMRTAEEVQKDLLEIVDKFEDSPEFWGMKREKEEWEKEDEDFLINEDKVKNEDLLENADNLEDGEKGGIDSEDEMSREERWNEEKKMREESWNEGKMLWIKTISEGVGLMGEEAKNFVQGDIVCEYEMSREEQMKLFHLEKDRKIVTANRIFNKADVVELYGSADFETRHWKIKGLVLDLLYRGDYTGETRKFLQKHIVNNDLCKLKEVMEDQKNWKDVPADRFKRRIQYLDNPAHATLGAIGISKNEPFHAKSWLNFP